MRRMVRRDMRALEFFRNCIIHSATFDNLAAHCMRTYVRPRAPGIPSFAIRYF